MLVLSRKVGEKIVIDGKRIIVTVLEIRPDKVRLGFIAPKEVKIDREEVQKRKQESFLFKDCPTGSE